MRRILVTATLVALTAGLTGCQIGAGSGATASHPPADGTGAAATAAPTSTFSDAQITAWVDRSAPSKADVGADTVEDHSGPKNVHVPCPDAGVGLINIVWTHAWYWTGGPIRYLIERVVGVSGPPAKDQAATILGYTHQCRTYQSSDAVNTYSVTITGDYAVLVNEVFDGGGAWCEQYTQLSPADGKGVQRSSCSAIFSRGPVMMWLQVYGELPTVASAQSKLDLAVRLTVPAFIKALPR